MCAAPRGNRPALATADSRVFAFRLGIQNAFDKKSPVVGDTVGARDANAGSTFPNTCDVIGRRYFASLTAKY